MIRAAIVVDAAAVHAVVLRLGARFVLLRLNFFLSNIKMY